MDNLIEHPFEDLFDIESGTTVLPELVEEEVKLTNFDLFDDKDIEIEQQYETIYNAAFAAFTNQCMAVERGSDPGHTPRNMEVANQFLTTALNAVKEKADLKHKKEKNRVVSSKNITNNNLIMDRKDILDMIQNGTLK